MGQLPRLGKRELIDLLLFTCNYVVSVWRGFLFLRVLGMGYIILLWHSLSLPYNYFQFAKYFTRIFIDQNIFYPDLSYTVSQYFMTLALMAVSQEINNLESSVVVQELEFAMNLALYRLDMKLNQYIGGSLSWRSLTSTANLLGISFESLLVDGCFFKSLCIIKFLF